MVVIQTMSYVMYNDFECHTPKLSTFLAIYPSAGAPVFQSASFARAPVCQSASLPECQFAKVPVRTGGKIVSLPCFLYCNRGKVKES